MREKSCYKGVCVGLLVCLQSLSMAVSPGHAADFIVNGVSNETNGGAANILDGDDTITVTTTGEIIPPGGAFAVLSNGPNNVVTNNGQLISGSVAIRSFDTNVLIVNRGLALGFDSAIRTSDADAVIINSGRAESAATSGIQTLGARTQLTNVGEIVGFLNGVEMSGIGSVVENTGQITAGDDGVVTNSQSTTISNSGIISAAQSGILSAGSNALITNSGGILADTGVLIVGQDSQVYSTGVISALSDGISVAGNADNSTIINHGQIISQTRGIRTNGDNTTVINSGEIIATGTGFQSSGLNNTLTNSGLIEVANGAGVVILNDSNSFFNSGTLIASSAAVIGATFDTRIVNTGRIFSATSFGIELAGDDSRFFNAGTLSAPNGNAVVSTGHNVEITNEGSIFTTLGAGQYSLSLGGSNAQLNLEADSVLQGEIFVNDPSTASISIGLPHAVLTFDGGIPDNIDARGAEFFEVGDTLYVVSADSFEASGNRNALLAGSVNDVVAAQRGYIYGTERGRSSTRQMSFLETEGAAHRGARGVWISGFYAPGLDTDAPGLLLGGYARLANGTYLDVFVGRSESDLGTDLNADVIDTQTALLGLSWGGATGFGFFDLGLVLGRSSYDGQRRVANNLVDGGYETTHFQHDSTFISPSLTLGTEQTWGRMTVIPSVRLGYTIQDVEGYQETNSTAPLSVGDRTVRTADLRAQVGFGLEPIDTGIGALSLSASGGLQAVRSDGDEVPVNLAGQTFSLTASEDDFDITTFATAHAALDFGAGAELFLGGALAADGASDTGFNINFGFSKRF